MSRGRVGEERGGKETDGCPLTRTCTFKQVKAFNLIYLADPKISVTTTAVAGLHNGFEGLSAVDVHQNGRGECT
jgi:hypothetical protein